jgi:hypothetical protein
MKSYSARCFSSITDEMFVEDYKPYGRSHSCDLSLVAPK